jgi:hypothetical protein
MVLARVGCASKPPAMQTGFLGDYSNLKEVNDSRMTYVSPELAQYNTFIIDPLEFTFPPEKLTPQQRADVANHFNRRLVELATNEGFTVTTTPGVGVGRVQVALTGVANSSWWKKIHPVSRMAGAGTGGAAMEAEIIDSVTGAQVAAVVQAATGNQFNFTNFSTVADVNSAIDRWAATASRTLKELRAQAR